MDIFSVAAKIKLDTQEFTDGLKKAGDKIGAFTSKIGGVVKKVATVGGGMLAAGATAISGLVKQSVDAYGKYEQLVGGMETLFKDSSAEIIGYASEAYKTAGMSANQYMETATQFSASLLKSLDGDTAKAAKYADKAIRQMSDNVNKMGTNVEMVQNAYRGFARGNFTMLDNLSLGYAGTKEGMEELLAKATELSEQQGEYREFSIDSYADIVDAIGLVQDAMGITGTTAKEAAGTVQGSAGSMKAAWENLVTGLGDSNADLETLIGQLVDSATGMAKNIAPIVDTALRSITSVISEQAPELISGAIGFVEDMTPGLVKASTALFTSLVDSALQGLDELSGLISGDEGNKLAEIINSAVNYIGEKVPEFFNAGLNLFSALLNSDNLTLIIDNIGKELPALIAGIIGSKEDGTGIAGHFDDIVDGGLDLFSHLVDNIPGIIAALGEGLGNLVSAIGEKITDKEFLKSLGQTAISLGKAIVEGIVEGIKNFGKAIKDAVEYWLNPGAKEPELKRSGSGRYMGHEDDDLHGDYNEFREGWHKNEDGTVEYYSGGGRSFDVDEQDLRGGRPRVYGGLGDPVTGSGRTADINVNVYNANGQEIVDEVTKALGKKGVYAQ